MARENGAIGGKLIGAGGGGFLMFMADDPKRLRRAMAAEGLSEMRFKFDFEERPDHFVLPFSRELLRALGSALAKARG